MNCPFRETISRGEAFNLPGDPYVGDMAQQVASSGNNSTRVPLLAYWLLLLSIFTHAVIPVGFPLQRTAGSAFSAATADVSLVPTRKSFRTEEGQLATGGKASRDGNAPSGDGAITAASAALVGPALHALGPAPVLPASDGPSGGAAPFKARGPPLS